MKSSGKNKEKLEKNGNIKNQNNNNGRFNVLFTYKIV